MTLGFFLIICITMCVINCSGYLFMLYFHVSNRYLSIISTLNFNILYFLYYCITLVTRVYMVSENRDVGARGGACSPFQNRTTKFRNIRDLSMVQGKLPFFAWHWVLNRPPLSVQLPSLSGASLKLASSQFPVHSNAFGKYQ